MAQQNYYYGTGKRKTAIAQVRIYPGQGHITINEKPLGEVFPLPALQSVILEPMNLTSMGNKFNICLLYTSPSPRDATLSRMPSSA